jgi:cytochrome c6
LRRTGRAGFGGAALAAIAVVVLLASGCGYGGVATAAEGDTGNGQKLFTTPPPNGGLACSSCHTLQAVGSSGTIGPDLDNVFVEDRRQGYDNSSIENVVLDQIRLGSGPIATYTKGEHGVKGLKPQTTMPANIWTGQNAVDIAAYVASVAGLNGYVKQVNLATLTSGASIFKEGPCSGCHTMKAAGTHGTAGPNLDTIANALTVAIVLHQVTNGGGAMPAFQGTLTPAQIQAVSKYVIAVAGKK